MERNKNTSSIIYELRKSRHLEQTEVALALGVSREVLNHWESGTRQIKGEHLVKLATYYGVSADYLLGLTESPSTDETQIAAEKYTGLSSQAVTMLATLKNSETYKPLLHVMDRAISSPIFILKFVTALATWATVSKRSDDDYLDNLTDEQIKVIDELFKLSAAVLSPERASRFYAEDAKNALGYYLDSINSHNSDMMKEMYRTVESDLLEQLHNGKSEVN